MKKFITYLKNTIFYTALFMTTTAIGALTMITIMQQGGGGAAMAIIILGFICNSLLFTFISLIKKLSLVANLAGITALIIFLPALAYLNMLWMNW